MADILSIVRSAVAPLTRTKLFRRVGPVVMPPLERVIARFTGGRVQLSGLLVPTLVLHTVGARSGQARDSVLMYTADGRGRAIVAGTSFAREKHPAWTYNLLATPNAALTVRGRTLEVRAEQLTGDTRERAWRRIERQWPGYRSYERQSGRTVRLFLLVPVREAARNRLTDTPG
jgi:deazaflavin-dependent oxidoreductase (nitroreductase family)